MFVFNRSLLFIFVFFVFYVNFFWFRTKVGFFFGSLCFGFNSSSWKWLCLLVSLGFIVYYFVGWLLFSFLRWSYCFRCYWWFLGVVCRRWRVLVWNMEEISYCGKIFIRFCFVSFGECSFCVVSFGFKEEGVSGMGLIYFW